MQSPRVSIILPTWNGAADLARLLPRLAEQQFEGGFEIVAIDSDSVDGTRSLLEAAGASVERIEQREYKHGATRNRAAARARGEFLVFLSQDALPRDAHFLASIVAAFDDEKTAGVTCRILPHASDDPLTARTVLDAPEASSEPRTIEGPRKDRRDEVRFNNVASAIRARVFREIPFPDVAFGEDVAWADLALARGWRLCFVPESVVFHAHRYTPSQAFARYKIDAAFQRTVHDRRVRPSLVSVVKGIAYEMRRDWRFVRREKASLWALWRSPFLRAAQVFGQYVGSRG
jgi:rhamnosyltransferase